jgi:multiple sugar transport system permease protein
VNTRPKALIIKVLDYGFLAVVLVLFLFPIFWMFLTSIKRPVDTFAIPPVWVFKPTWENYAQTFLHKEYYRYLWNSLSITTASIVLATFLSALAAYGTSRFRFVGRNQLLLGLLIFYTIPGIAYAIPLFLVFGRLGLLDTALGLILVFTALTIPFATWVLHGYFVSIPRDLEEAAMVDGCSRLRALFRVTLPLSAPGVAATAVLTFISTWNSFLYPAILAGSRTKTLPVAVAAFITDTRIEWGQAAAVASTIIIPVLALTISAQRFIVMGLTGGAVKE